MKKKVINIDFFGIFRFEKFLREKFSDCYVCIGMSEHDPHKSSICIYKNLEECISVNIYVDSAFNELFKESSEINRDVIDSDSLTINVSFYLHYSYKEKRRLFERPICKTLRVKLSSFDESDFLECLRFMVDSKLSEKTPEQFSNKTTEYWMVHLDSLLEASKINLYSLEA